MDVVHRAAEEGASPADLGGGCYIMPPLKAFMDDTTILFSKANETHRMLIRLDALMNLGRMSLKPQKSRSLSVRKGKIDEDVCFKVTSRNIPMISQEPAKSLGRWYDSSLKDTKCESEALGLNFNESASYRQQSTKYDVSSLCLSQSVCGHLL
ncbi:reverse transcriptase [Plakobranchus ocellatus]|uniref:Reverse transcriptase n=1 Tax=Plakobranchus ocellatus TaxID=259542 RepID=A0AAV3ZJ58_9GAST|nr:reverse transcriptase [Plakobranchus ocellatus]